MIPEKSKTVTHGMRSGSCAEVKSMEKNCILLERVCKIRLIRMRCRLENKTARKTVSVIALTVVQRENKDLYDWQCTSRFKATTSYPVVFANGSYIVKYRIFRK